MLDIQCGPEDERADSNYDDGDLDSIGRYGNWERNNENGRFFIPSALSGSDYSPGGTMSESNLRTFRKTFPRGEGRWWKEVAGGHGTYAVVIDLKKVPTKRHKEVEEFFGALSDYPVADEQEMSEVEMEKQTEAWEGWASRDFKDALEKEFDLEFDEVDDSKLHQLFDLAAERANEYWVNESGGDMWISIDRIMKKGKITIDEIDALEATYVGEPGDSDGPGFFIVLDSHDAKHRETVETVYEDFPSAEEAAWTVYRESPKRRVEVRQADTRQKAREGYGHVWWINGVTRGPAVDPRQESLFAR